jgi:alpha-galactosidase
LGAIVETNAVFSNDCVSPIVAKELPDQVKNLILPHVYNLETVYEGIKNRDLHLIFTAFLNDSLCVKLSFEDAETLFKKMLRNTREYLDPYFDLEDYLD